MERSVEEIKEDILLGLKNVYDPEIPVNVYDLGLIYKYELDEYNNVEILMTLTAPNCPMADILLENIRSELKEIKEVQRVDIELTFDPPWDPEKLSEEAKLELGML